VEREGGVIGGWLLVVSCWQAATGVGQDGLDGALRNFKLFRDFSDAYAVVEVIDDGADW
jgi:hypothetical protein